MRVAVVLASLVLVATAHGRTALERVEVIRDPLAVRLHLSSPVAASAHTLPPQRDRPDRVYVDLLDTTLRGVAMPALTGVSPLLQVRTGQFDLSTVRVVLDLAGPVPFAVRR